VRQIEEEDAARRAHSHAETVRKYEGIKRAPALHETKNTVLALRARIEDERMAPCRVRFHAKPAPKFTADAQVKLTAASILREDALYKKKQAKEAAVLKKYESELRDTSKFYMWQEEERRKEEAAKLARVERLRHEMHASHQAARDAIAANLKRNQVNAANMRVDGEIVLVKREKEQIALKQEIAERIERQEAEDVIEQERRNDMIRQIRAIERVPKLKAKVRCCWRYCCCCWCWGVAAVGCGMFGLCCFVLCVCFKLMFD
jgi:hypothetical protein